MLYSGSLNIYFPCKLKETRMVKETLKCWNRQRGIHRRMIEMKNRPLTDLTDIDTYRQENENIIGTYCLKRLGKFVHNSELLPYALSCLQKGYRYSFGKHVYIKIVNVLLSRFVMTHSNIPNNEIEGILLCNINLDNLVATYTVVLNFKDLTIDQIILLKHFFYKRALVSIREYEIESVCKDCNLGASEACNYKCISTGGLQSPKVMTFQEFIQAKHIYNRFEVSLSLDTKARFSLLELDELIKKGERNQIIKGLMTADEGYEFHKQEREFRSISNRDSYEYYLSGTHGLITVSRERHTEYVKSRIRQQEMLNLPETHVNLEKRMEKACLAGLDVDQFSAYMRAVEIHYLINSVLANDIVPREQSYFNPIIFVRRGYRLWKIIYELDINRYYVHKEVFDSFCINDNMEKIRNEYKTILTHGVAYFALIISLLSLIMAI